MNAYRKRNDLIVKWVLCKGYPLKKIKLLHRGIMKQMKLLLGLGKDQAIQLYSCASRHLQHVQIAILGVIQVLDALFTIAIK